MLRYLGILAFILCSSSGYLLAADNGPQAAPPSTDSGSNTSTSTNTNTSTSTNTNLHDPSKSPMTNKPFINQVDPITLEPK